MGTQTILLMFPWSQSPREVWRLQNPSVKLHTDMPHWVWLHNEAHLSKMHPIYRYVQTCDMSSEKKHWQARHREQMFVPCWRIVIHTESGTTKCFLRLDFTANKYQLMTVKFRLKSHAEGDFTPKWQQLHPVSRQQLHLVICTKRLILINKIISLCTQWTLSTNS